MLAFQVEFCSLVALTLPHLQPGKLYNKFSQDLTNVLKRVRTIMELANKPPLENPTTRAIKFGVGDIESS